MQKQMFVWNVSESKTTINTNIYNFIDSLLVQDVHSYFVNQKRKKTQLYGESCLGMLAYEMIIIVMVQLPQSSNKFNHPWNVCKLGHATFRQTMHDSHTFHVTYKNIEK